MIVCASCHLPVSPLRVYLVGYPKRLPMCGGCVQTILAMARRMVRDRKGLAKVHESIVRGRLE